MRKLISFILFSSLTLFPVYEEVNACIDIPDNEELRYMLFNPDLEENKSWWTFFYNSKVLYMGEMVHSAEDERIIAAEWAKELKTKVSVDEIYRCLFVLNTDSARRQNAFYKEIQSQSAYKKYFDFAFECENSSGLNYDPWERSDPAISDSLTKIQGVQSDKAIANLRQEKNPFLKKRYAFQALKLSYYFFDKARFDSVYQAYFSTEPSSPIDWWALHYKSMIYGQTSQEDSATYLHALVFENSSAKMLASRLTYSRKNFASAYRLTKNDKERADLYVLNETINPGRSLTNLQKIYELNPEHRHLPMLISREINKLEDWLGSTQYINQYPINRRTFYWGDEPEGTVMSNWQSDRAYLDQFYLLLAGMKDVERLHSDFYHLSLAYLNVMRENHQEARKQLALVKSTASQVVFQMNVMKVVLCAQEMDIRSEKAQQQIGELLNTLTLTRKGEFESQKVLYSLCRQLQFRYAQAGMIHYAGLFDYLASNSFCYFCKSETFEYSIVSYFDQYASAKDIEQLIQVTDRKNKNALQYFLLRPYPHNYYFYDVLSVKYLRNGDTKHALAALNKIPDTFWEKHVNANYCLDDDPFNHVETLLQNKGFSRLNKREIIQQLTDLEAKADKGTPAERAKTNTLLGNAWYNFGNNSWYMLNYYQLSSLDPLILNSYKRAFKYYQEAMKFETSQEKKAQLAYMLFACASAKEEKAYAKTYEKEYASTKFYNDRACSYSRYIINN